MDPSQPYRFFYTASMHEIYGWKREHIDLGRRKAIIYGGKKLFHILLYQDTLEAAEKSTTGELDSNNEANSELEPKDNDE